MRILVAEDEQMLADLVAEGLRKHAMAVDLVYDGEAASQRLTVNDYDVLVLDRDLPQVHGDAICRELAQTGARTRILMLTAAASVAERVPWAIYRVRRLYCAPAEESANPMRQTERRTLENAVLTAAPDALIRGDRYRIAITCPNEDQA